MALYFVGIDISKYKHDCCIISAADQQVAAKFTFRNDCEGFDTFVDTLQSFPEPKNVRIGFYHSYSLKSLTRLRDRLIRQRSIYLVKLTNVLDHTFPEFKPFFGERFSKTALYLLENYGTAKKMSHMNSASYENLRSVSKGKFSPQQFLKLKDLAKNTVGVSSSIFALERQQINYDPRFQFGTRRQ